MRAQIGLQVFLHEIVRTVEKQFEPKPKPGCSHLMLLMVCGNLILIGSSFQYWISVCWRTYVEAVSIVNHTSFILPPYCFFTSFIISSSAPGKMTTARYRPTWDLALDPLVSCKLCLGEFPLEQMTTITQCQCVFCTLVSIAGSTVTLRKSELWPRLASTFDCLSISSSRSHCVG